MEIRRFMVSISLTLCLLMTIAACGTTKKVYHTTKSAVSKIKPSSPGLKKRVLMLPVTDDAGAGEVLAARIHQDLIENLKRSDAVVLYETTEPVTRPKNNPEPEYGLTFNPKALQIAQDTGMNAIVSPILYAVNTTTERGGPLPLWPSFFPFGETNQKYEVSLIVNVRDVRCGVLMMSHLESEEKTLSVEEVQTRDSDQILEWLLEETISGIVERQSEEILDVLEGAPWYGKILSVEGDTIRISGGTDVGIQKEMVFNVFGEGETVECQDGRSLELLGPVTGQIQVTSVMEKESLATPVAEGTFLSGMIIQPTS